MTSTCFVNQVQRFLSTYSLVLKLEKTYVQ